MNGNALGALMVGVIGICVTVWAWAKIFRKAGYPWWNAFAMAIPFLNLVSLIWFALADWPVEDEVLKLQLRYGISEESVND